MMDGPIIDERIKGVGLPARIQGSESCLSSKMQGNGRDD